MFVLKKKKKRGEQWRAGVGQGSCRAAEVWASPMHPKARFLPDLEAAETIFTYLA